MTGLFTPPVFEDKKKTRIAGRLNIILLCGLGLVAAAGIVNVATSPRPIPHFITACALLGGLSVHLHLYRKGYIRLVRLLFPITAWIMITLVVLFSGGINSPNIIGYVPLILVVGLIFGLRNGTGATATMYEGMLRINPDGRIIQANPAAERILGLERSEIEGRSYVSPEWEILRPDGTLMPPEEMAGPRAMKEKRPVNDVVMGVRRPDGSICWIIVNAAPIMDAAGQLEAVVGTIADITARKQAEFTERKRAEEAFAMEQERPSATPRGIGDGVIATDIDRQAVLINQAADTLTGQSQEEALPAESAERKQADEALSNLIEIIQFTEHVSAKMHGLVNEAEIYRTVKEEFAQLKRYTASILLFTDDDSSLRIAEVSLSPAKVKAGEKATGLWMKGYKIDLKKSGIYSQVVREGKTVQVSVSDIIGELLPRPLAHLISKTMGYGKETSILTPLKRHGKIIGAFAMTCPELAEHFMPSVKNLAQHISNALERADENTEHKRADEALLEGEERYRKLFEEARDGIFLADAETGVIVDCNRAAAELVGRDKSELIGQHQKILHPPRKVKGRFTESFKKHLEDSEGQVLEEQVITSSGEIKEVAIKANLLNVGGRKLLQGMFRDITERKRAGEALRTERDKLKQIFEAMDDGVYIVNQDYDIEYVNPVLIADFGPYEGRKCYAYFHDREEVCPWCKNQDIFAGNTVRWEWYSFKNGKTYDLIDTPIRNADGTISKLEIFRDITERKRAEEALNESEKKYRDLVDNALVGVFKIDIRGDVLYVNEALSRMLEFESPEELMSESVLSRYKHPEEREVLFERLKQEGTVNNFELEVLTKTGKTLNLLLSGTLRGDFMSGMVRDITERRRAEETLIRTNRALRLVSECNQVMVREKDEIQLLDAICEIIVEIGGYRLAWVGLAEHDRQKTVRPVSWMGYEKGYLETLKITWADAEQGRGPTGTAIRTGEPVIARDIPNDPAFAPWRKEALKRDYASSISLPLKIADQAIGALNIYSPEPDAFIDEEINLLRELGDDLAHGIMALRAQAERKQAEEALAMERERLSTTLRGIVDGVITTDIDLQVVLINRAAETLTGWSQEEALGRPLAEVLTLVDETSGRAIDLPTIEILKAQVVVLPGQRATLISRSDSRIPVSLIISPLKDRESQVIGMVMDILDITERKRLESEMLRSAKLESLGVLAGGLAHDFNNFLMSIMLNLSTARLYLRDDPKAAGMLKDAEESTRRAREITRQLATLSRGGVPVKASRYLTPLLKEAVNFSLHGSLVRPWFRLEEELWPVEIDHGQINQVLNNLAINAAQAMPEGGTLTVTTANVTVDEEHPRGPLSQGQYVEVALTDKGTGIPPEDLDKIFDPYFTTKETGSGLGLFSVYSIINKHNGWITVDSEVNKGTTFTFYLPAAEEAVIPPYSKESEAMKKIISGTGRILVMDDDELIRKALGRLLDDLGFETAYAPDGAAVLELFKLAHSTGKPFRAAILDFSIPGGMGGVETLARIREIDPEAKAIITSGYANAPIMAHYEDYGFQGRLAKPFTAVELSEVLKDVLGEK